MQLTQLSFQVQWHAWRGQESKFSPIFRPTNQPFSAERATLWLFNAFGLLNLPPIFQFSNCECVSVSLRQLEAKLKLQLFHCTMLTMLLLCVCPKNKAKKVEKDRGPNKKKGNQAKGCLIKLAQVRFVKMPKICLRKFSTSGTNKSRCCSICSTSSCRVCLARFACKTCVKLKHRLVKRRCSPSNRRFSFGFPFGRVWTCQRHRHWPLWSSPAGLPSLFSPGQEMLGWSNLIAMRFDFQVSSVPLIPGFWFRLRLRLRLCCKCT